MKKVCLCILITIYLTSCTRTYYIVRHAEKAAADASMGSDVPLSSLGQQRAIALKNELLPKKIKTIYATNTIRARATAEPLSTHINIPITSYGPLPDTAFIRSLKTLKGNTLVVGHSNTVDDIVNGLANEKKISDLVDSVYDNLYIIKFLSNGSVKVKQVKYGNN